MSNIKLFRAFFGGYVANRSKLQDMHYRTIKYSRPVLIAITADQGFGQIKGTTKKVGTNYSLVPVCVFRRSNRQLLWETRSKADGSYVFRNIAKGLECFVVAFDPAGQFNAVIQDKVVAK